MLKEHVLNRLDNYPNYSLTSRFQNKTLLLKTGVGGIMKDILMLLVMLQQEYMHNFRIYKMRLYNIYFSCQNLKLQ